MYCKECGKKIDDDSKYCRFCGKNMNITFDEMKQAESISTNVLINVNDQSDISKSNTKSNDIIKKDSLNKYDESYQKEYSATIVGFVVMAIYLFLLFTKILALGFLIPAIINFIWSVIATIWVTNIAKRQNRNTLGWGIFGFFLSNLALVIIGLQKKLNVVGNPIESTQVNLDKPIFEKKSIHSEEEKNRLMDFYNITLENEKYIYGSYQYEKLNDAINYAEFERTKDTKKQ